MSGPLGVHLWIEVAMLSVAYQTLIAGFSIISCDVFSGAKSIQRFGDAHRRPRHIAHPQFSTASESSLPSGSSLGLRVGRLVPGTLDPWWNWYQQQLSRFKLAALGGRGPAERPKESAQPLHCHPWVVSVWKCHSEWKKKNPLICRTEEGRRLSAGICRGCGVEDWEKAISPFSSSPAEGIALGHDCLSSWYCGNSLRSHLFEFLYNHRVVKNQNSHPQNAWICYYHLHPCQLYSHEIIFGFHQLLGEIYIFLSLLMIYTRWSPGDMWPFHFWWCVYQNIAPESSKHHASLQQKTDYLMSIFTYVDKQSLHCKVEKTEK